MALETTLAALFAVLATQAPATEAPPEPERWGQHALAFGPIPLGDSIWSAELGWLRSGLRGDIGLGVGLDLTFRGDGFLLHDFFGGQSSLLAGARFSPFDDGPLRLSAEGSVGQVFGGRGAGGFSNFVLRGELTAGYAITVYGTPYLRGAIRALGYDVPGDDGWGRDEELGVGYEVSFHRFVGAVEGFLWARPSRASLPQWRARVGIAL
jgi:hypothetical protein